MQHRAVAVGGELLGQRDRPDPALIQRRRVRDSLHFLDEVGVTIGEVFLDGRVGEKPGDRPISKRRYTGQLQLKTAGG